MHCLRWNKLVSNRILCASLLFSWTSQPQLRLDGSWVSHLYFLTDINITLVARVMFLRSSTTLTVGKFTSVASVTFSGSKSVKRKWKGDLQKYLGYYISGSAPTIQSAKKRNRLATEVWATGNSEAASPMLVISRISTRNHTPWRCALEKEGLTPYHFSPLRILYKNFNTFLLIVTKIKQCIISDRELNCTYEN